MNNQIIKASLFLLLLGLVFSSAFGQKNEPKLNKIIINEDSLIYYSISVDAIGKVYEDYKINTINEIYKKKNTEFLVIKGAQMRRKEFGDLEVSQNFLITENNLVCLSMKKTFAFFARTSLEYWGGAWKVKYQHIKINDSETFPKGDLFFNHPVVQLNVWKPLYSHKPIFYDFFQYKEDIFLMILADHSLYLYESVGGVEANQWQLKKTYPGLKFQSFFRAYKDDACNLILDFGSNESYCIDLENESATLIETDPHENKCLVHNHLTDEFLWLTPAQAKELIASDEAVKYISQFKRE